MKITPLSELFLPISMYSNGDQRAKSKLVGGPDISKNVCYYVLQAIFQQHQILGSKVGHDRAIGLQC